MSKLAEQTLAQAIAQLRDNSEYDDMIAYHQYLSEIAFANSDPMTDPEAETKAQLIGEAMQAKFGKGA